MVHNSVKDVFIKELQKEISLKYPTCFIHRQRTVFYGVQRNTI